VQPSPELGAIVATELLPGELLKIEAVAGAGKSTALMEYAKAHAARRARERALAAAVERAADVSGARVSCAACLLAACLLDGAWRNGAVVLVGGADAVERACAAANEAMVTSRVEEMSVSSDGLSSAQASGTRTPTCVPLAASALRAHVEGAAQLERPVGLRSRAASAAQRWPRARRPPRPVAAITTPLLFHNQNDPHGRLLRPAVVITPTLWAVARRPLGVPRRLPADGCRPR